MLIILFICDYCLNLYRFIFESNLCQVVLFLSKYLFGNCSINIYIARTTTNKDARWRFTKTTLDIARWWIEIAFWRPGNVMFWTFVAYWATVLTLLAAGLIAGQTLVATNKGFESTDASTHFKCSNVPRITKGGLFGLGSLAPIAIMFSKRNRRRRRCVTSCARCQDAASMAGNN